MTKSGMNRSRKIGSWKKIEDRRAGEKKMLFQDENQFFGSISGFMAL